MSKSFADLMAETRRSIREVSLEDLRRRQDQGEPFVLVDVREHNEYAAGHLPGAVHMSKGVIERDAETKVPDPATPLVLYCGGGYRSALAADNLQKMGYTNVISMDGGWRGWTQASWSYYGWRRWWAEPSRPRCWPR